MQSINKRHQLTWRRLQQKNITLIQLMLSGGIVNNAIRQQATN